MSQEVRRNVVILMHILYLLNDQVCLTALDWTLLNLISHNLHLRSKLALHIKWDNIKRYIL